MSRRPLSSLSQEELHLEIENRSRETLKAINNLLRVLAEEEDEAKVPVPAKEQVRAAKRGKSDQVVPDISDVSTTPRSKSSSTPKQ
jgi:hypothetical protein